MDFHLGVYILFVVSFVLTFVSAAEFTFELPDRDTQCFYEELQKDIKYVIEFQVISGGNYDVDVILTGPDNTELYNQQKKQYDSHEFTPTQHGVYSVCFNNQFSTFTHKTIYFEWQSTKESPLKPDMEKSPTALTMMETSGVNIHEALNVVADYQTHIRNRESTGRTFAEDLNDRVTYWSVGQSVIILLVGIGQVMVLRSFFSEKKPLGSASVGMRT